MGSRSPASHGIQIPRNAGLDSVLPENAWPLCSSLEIWCHGCAEGSSRAGTGPSGRPCITFLAGEVIRRPSSNNRQARMNPTGRDASVEPDAIAALSCSVVTDRPWLFAGMTAPSPGVSSVSGSRSGGLSQNLRSSPRVTEPVSR